MPDIVVAIPVRDEAALIGDCLRALALQEGPQADILLLVNNSRDGTAGLARAVRPTLPCRVHVIEHEFAPDQANAGQARRLAMEHACALCAPGGIAATTDADGCVAPDWLGAILAAFEAGAEMVCGRAVIDPVDALRIPRHLHDDDALEVAFGTALDRIAGLLDPDPADPWPRHTEESGASLAMYRDRLLSVGGVPAVRSGEDRALVAAFRRVDARIRHEPSVWVTVSGRTQGRAEGGMAETIARRIVRQDMHVDASLEPVADRVRRIELRKRARLAWTQDRRGWPLPEMADELCVTPGLLRTWLGSPHFGTAWAQVERHSPVLARTPMPRHEVASQLRLAHDTLARLDGTSSLQPRGLIRPEAAE